MLSVRGDRLSRFVLDQDEDSRGASEAAIRITASRAARELRGIIRKRFSTKGRVYAARGWAKAIRVKKISGERYEVVDNATYRRGRTAKVGLSWVFDNAPTIQGKTGWVAVPIRGKAPIARSGRRYMWPSEAAQNGFELQFVGVPGKRMALIYARRNRFDPWTAMWFWVPPYKARKAYDLDTIHRKYGEQMDQVWGEELDRRTIRRVRKSV